MTNKIKLFCISTIFILCTGFKIENESKLIVEITGYEKKQSTKIFVSVFSKKDFLKKSVQTKSVNVTDNKVTVSFDLPQGDYAVSTYHDLNNNQKLDRHFYGKPKEPTGFSNNIKPSFGPPDYEDCKISLGNSSKNISIKIN